MCERMEDDRSLLVRLRAFVEQCTVAELAFVSSTANPRS